MDRFTPHVLLRWLGIEPGVNPSAEAFVHQRALAIIVFLAALPVVAIAFVISLFIQEIPLRTRDTPAPAEATEL